MPIQTVTTDNFDDVLPLVAAYQVFYGAEADEVRNRQHFGRFLNDHTRGIQFFARDDAGHGVGMATLYFTYSSVRAGEQCLMNDLYVVPEVRGRGVGRALIEHCRTYARERGYPAIVWATAADNATAQRLYDGLSAGRSEWVHYRLPV